MSITRDLPHLDGAINQESYEWLIENSDIYATAVYKEVAGGATPEQIYQHVMRKTQRHPLALRCKQAAAHLMALQEAR